MSDTLPTAADLTTAQKAALTSGADFWHTKAVGDVPAMMLTDGPHGLRKQAGTGDHLGLEDSIPATCFPPAVGLGAAWDPDLAERVGIALGKESAAEGVSVILGPGINIKRSPLCGRNFEYFSEDPLVTACVGAGLVRGIQSQGVGASLKHFAANNQETDRMRVSADVAPRPLREIYLRAFERVIADANPWTVMCSYNRINGVYASEDPWLLTQVLREEWGYDGLVVSDWGAVNDRVAALIAGLDLEMPASGGVTDAQIVAAIEAGRLDEAVLDVAVSRAIGLVERTRRTLAPEPIDVDAHHALAREAATRSIVLLRNEGILPLARGARVAVVGAFAENPRYQGAGSSLINPTRLDVPLDEIRAFAEATYAPGFALAGSPDATLRDEAVAVAAEADAIVMFLGLPDAAESEGFDREHLDLPADQLALLAAVRAVNSNVVVVLSHGGVVALPFRDEVSAIVDASLLGQGGGHAIARVLFGEESPSGRLAETIPEALRDNPAYGNFPGEFGHVSYGEGVFVGYRGYDARGTAVAYPFGHGLSYTSFAYGEVDVTETAAGLSVRVPVTNTGGRDGREVVQVYALVPGSVVARPPRELVGFASVEIAAGETREVVVAVRREDLAYWDVRVDRWVVEGGAYVLEVGASSRDLRAAVSIEIAGDAVVVPLGEDSSIGEALAHPVAGPLIRAGIDQMFGGAAGSSDNLLKMMMSFPLGRLGTFPGSPVSSDGVRALIAAANA